MSMNLDGASVLLKPIIHVDPVILFSRTTFLLTSIFFKFNDLKKTRCQKLKYSTEIGYNWVWEIPF
jgi:hypothetical protein